MYREAGAGRASAAYDSRPDFYETTKPVEKPRRPKRWSAALAGLAVITSFYFLVPALFRSVPAETTIESPVTNAVPSRQEMEQELESAVRAGRPVPELAYLRPAEREAVASGALRIRVIRVSKTGPPDLVRITVNGQGIGQLNMGQLGSRVAFVYRPGEPLEIGYHMAIASGAFALQHFLAPDGQSRYLLRGLHESSSWNGAIP